PPRRSHHTPVTRAARWGHRALTRSFVRGPAGQDTAGPAYRFSGNTLRPAALANLRGRGSKDRKWLAPTVAAIAGHKRSRAGGIAPADCRCHWAARWIARSYSKG